MLTLSVYIGCTTETFIYLKHLAVKLYSNKSVGEDTVISSIEEELPQKTVAAERWDELTT